MKQSFGEYQGKAWTGFRGSRDDLAARVADIPETPGVYAFRDANGEILYVGKAKDLRKRVRSYFAGRLSPKTGALVERAAGLETITVDSEVEALILELTLIKKHRPKYNILLRDDKTYPYIRVGLDEKWPRVIVVRRVKNDGAKYFGPFTRSSSVRETLSLLRRVFPYRSCSDVALAQAVRPCLDYHIGRCLGPCTGKLDPSLYRRTIEQVVRFLEGKHSRVRAELEKQMMDYASLLDFENAARVRDQICSLDDVTQRQKIVSPGMQDTDVLGLAQQSDTSFVALLPVREGRLCGREGFVLTGTGDSQPGDVLEAFVTQYYSAAPFVPRQVLLSHQVVSQSNLEEFLTGRRTHSAKRRSSVRIRVPQRGRLKELTGMAEDNARALMTEYVPRRERERQAIGEAMDRLAESLGLSGPPGRIEGYDVSNISGHQAVASMVVLTEGFPDKTQYRQFRMSVQGKPDDYAMIQEVLWRRFQRGLRDRERLVATGKAGRFSAFPDLIVVDGGKGQVSAAKEALDQLGLEIPIAGLAEKNEEIFVPGRQDAVLLPGDSGALYLVMRLRDEAHRFALTYHRELREKKALDSALTRVPGIGEARAQALMDVFGDVETLRKAPVEEIARVKGIGPRLAAKISSYLNDPRQSTEGSTLRF